MIKIYCSDSFSALNLSSDRWNELLCSSASPTVFQTYEYLKIWTEVYQPDKDLLLLSAYEDDDLIGIAPLQLIEKTYFKFIKIRKIVFIGEIDFEYADFIIKSGFEKEVLHAFVNFLFKLNLNFDWLDFRDIFYSSKTPSLIKGFKEFYVKIINSAICLFIDTKIGQENYYKQFSHKTLLTLHKKLIRLKDNFEVTFEITLDNIDYYLNKLAEYNINRMEAKNIFSFFLKENNARFIRILSNEFKKSDKLLLSILKLNNTVRSIYLCFQNDRTIYYFLSGYDSSLSNYSLGMLHLNYLIKYTFNNNLDRFDFLKGEDRYKYYWYPKEERLKRVVVVKNWNKRILRFVFIIGSLFSSIYSERSKSKIN